MDRKIFKLPFTKTSVTRYQCPTCDKGLLKIEKDTFHFKESLYSKKQHGHPEWEPEYIEFIYSGLFKCTNSTCGEFVSSTGIGRVEEDYTFDENGEPDRDYFEYFKPLYFTPHLKIFSLPKDTPKNVINEIDKSFSLLFSDPPSSANHIRIALEHLLTHLKIKRYNRINNKLQFISLHKRIQLLPRKYDHIQDIFVAIKWLGNAGSHSNHKVSLDDVFDSYELIEELLTEIFSNKRKKAKTLAKKINKNKGPK